MPPSDRARGSGLGRSLEDVLGTDDHASSRERRLPQLGLAPVPPAVEARTVLSALEAAFPRDVCGMASGSVIRLVGEGAGDNAAAFALTDRLLTAAGRRTPVPAGRTPDHEPAHLIARLTPPAVVGVVRVSGPFTPREERLFEAVTALAGSGLAATA